MATILVTGGAGFIGSHLVTRLVSDGHRVRVLDNLSSGRMENLSHLPVGSFEMVEGTLLKPADCEAAVGSAEFVLHQAAIPSVPRSIGRPQDTFDANVAGTQNLLEAARRAGVRKLVMASSSSVYGGATPATEDLPRTPRSPYAAHKACCEHLCEAYRLAFGLPTACLRYFNVFGPRQDPGSPYSAVIPAFIRAIRAGGPIEVHGDGLQTRDFTYVDNVVEANLLAIRTGMAGPFNVGCGRSYSLLDLVRGIEATLGKQATISYTAPRAGDVRDSLADTGRIARFGYEPAAHLREGLAKTAEWFDDEEA